MDEAQRNAPAGWYRDPQNPRFDRWWDGKQWTEITTSADPRTPRINQSEEDAELKTLLDQVYRISEENSERQHADENLERRTEKMGRLITISKLAEIVVKLTILAASVFILSIVPVTFTPFGQWHIGDVAIITVASLVARISVYGALLSSAVLMPIIALCKKGAKEQIIDQSWAGYLLEDGSLRDDYHPRKQYVSMTKRINATQSYCAIFAFLFAAVLAFLIHDWLIFYIGNPWTDLITLLAIPLVAFVVGSVSTALFSKKYELEDKDMYTHAKRLLSTLLD